jgi:hypothetical protein
MKLINLPFVFILFITSCGQGVENNTAINTSIDSSKNNSNEEEVHEEPDTKKWRKEYVSNYAKVEIMDTSFTDPVGKKIQVQTKYYCLFDSAIFIPKEYVWEDTTRPFVTHNYSHDIKIVIDTKVILSKTITKADFVDNLYPELKNYAILWNPSFEFDKEKYLFVFGYSLTIPITDVGVGKQLIIDEKGNITKED